MEKRIFGKWGLVNMKLWEALKALEENPKKIFKSNEGFGEVTLEYREGVKFIGIQKTSYGAFISELRDWHEVKQPVTWQEAIEAWANGGKVKCILHGKSFTYDSSKWGNMYSGDGYLCGSEILNGTWYIED